MAALSLQECISLS